MRILQMIDTLKWGGAQKMQVFLAESLCSLGFDITVATLRTESNSPIRSQLQSMGVEVLTFPFPRLFSPLSFLNLVQHIRQSRYDLIHAHLTYANLVGTLAGRLTGTPVIASQRTAGGDSSYTKTWRYMLENWVVRNWATRIMANGWAVADFAGKRFAPRKIDILPNAIDLIPPLDPQEFHRLRTELVGDSTRPLIISVGRLSPPKGFPDLLDAFALLHQEYPSAALAIAGGGILYETLSSQIKKLGLNGHAFLLGVRNDVPRLLAASDIYVSSSHWEGLPVSVLEAMAAGLPVVATNTGDIPHILIPGTGKIVPVGGVEQIKNALLELLNDMDKSSALGAAAKIHIEQDFSRESWNSRLLTLYARVLPTAQPVVAALKEA